MTYTPEQLLQMLKEDPPVIDQHGSYRWYKDGKYQRINVAGGIFYYIGHLHRDGDLPAVINLDGTKEYWINGVQVK